MGIRTGAQAPASDPADSLLALGEYEKAAASVSDAGSSITMHLKLAHIYTVWGKTEQALWHHRKVLSRQPHRILSQVAYADLLLKSERLSEADSIYKRLSKQFPDNPKFYFSRGLIREHQRDSTALSFFEAAAKADNGYYMAYFKISGMLLNNQDLPGAGRTARKGLRTAPNHTGLLLILAQAQLHQGYFLKAIDQFQKLILLGEESSFIHTNLGYLYYRTGKPQKAIDHYRLSLALEPKDPAVHHALGKLYAEKGELRKSEGHLLRAIILQSPQLDQEYLSLGITYTRLGTYQKALEAFEHALAEDPDNQRALYERAIAADNFFKDRASVIRFYQAYLNQYATRGDPALINFSKRRISQIKREMHLEK